MNALVARGSQWEPSATEKRVAPQVSWRLGETRIPRPYPQISGFHALPGVHSLWEGLCALQGPRRAAGPPRLDRIPLSSASCRGLSPMRARWTQGNCAPRCSGAYHSPRRLHCRRARPCASSPCLHAVATLWAVPDTPATRYQRQAGWGGRMQVAGATARPQMRAAVQPNGLGVLGFVG